MDLISQVNLIGELVRVDLIGKVDLIGDLGRGDLISKVDLIGDLGRVDLTGDLGRVDPTSKGDLDTKAVLVASGSVQQGRSGHQSSTCC